MPIADLIARIEAAKEPSRELDCLIAYVLDVSVISMPQTWRQYVDTVGFAHALAEATSHHSVWRLDIPHFSSSADAIMARIPEGWLVMSMQQACYNGGWKNERWVWQVHLMRPTARWEKRTISERGEAVNPALAFAMAILKIAADTANHADETASAA